MISIANSRAACSIGAIVSPSQELSTRREFLVICEFHRSCASRPARLSISAWAASDRNLDDVSNDRPNFTGDPSVLQWRRPGEPIDPSILNFFSLPTIGQSGNLPRNAGTGPGHFIFDLNVSREFRLNEKMRMRWSVEFDNVLNTTVFSFGSEFIDFNAFGPTATPAQRQAFLDQFLVTTRTMRPRQIRLGVRFSISKTLPDAAP